MTKMTLIKKSNFKQNIVFSDPRKEMSDDDHSDDDDTCSIDSSSDSAISTDFLESTDGKVTLGIHLKNNEEKECIIVHLLLPKCSPGSVYVDFDLKFTFLSASGDEGPFSFIITDEQFPSSTNPVLHYEIPYSQTPFDKNDWNETYMDENDNVTIQCTGHFNKIKLDWPLAKLVKKKEGKMNEALPKMLRSGCYSDVTLVALVSGKKFSVHKNVLAASSPVFARLFKGNNQDGKRQVLPISDISTMALELLLKFIYNDVRLLDYLNRPYELLDAAIKYDLDDLKDVVLKMLSQYIREVNPAQTRLLYQLAVEHQFDELKKDALESLKAYAKKEIFSAINNEEDFFNMVASMKSFQTEVNDESSIETILLKSENMQFDGFKVCFYSDINKIDPISGYLSMINDSHKFSFEKNYLLIQNKKFFGLKKKTTRLDVTKFIYISESPSFVKAFCSKFLPILFKYGSCGYDALLISAADKTKMLNFHKHLMVRVAALQTVHDSDKKSKLIDLFKKN